MLKLENVSLTVDTEEGNREILRQVNLELKKGHLYVFTGPNGGGKSSLAKLIMGIHRPESGRILFEGRDITDLDVTGRARLGIGYAFQQPPRFKGLTVGRILRLAGWDPETDRNCHFLKVVGLCPGEYLDREIDDSLSGGELKRIEIATLMARSPRLAIFDEPEAGIDLWSFAKLTETFGALHERNPEGALLIISHQEKIMELADEIVLVQDGQVVRQGKRQDLLPGILEGDLCCGFTCEKEF